MTATTGFRVQRKMCATCIYRPDSPLNIQQLERQVADPHGGFHTFRVCHHSKDVCCRGFWEAHKDHFPIGQVAQRLGIVVFVDVDTLAEKMPKVRILKKRHGETFDQAFRAFIGAMPRKPTRFLAMVAEAERLRTIRRQVAARKAKGRARYLKRFNRRDS